MEPEASDILVETETALQWLGADGIVRHSFHPGARLDLAAARSNLAAIVQVSQGRRRPLVADMVSLRSVTREGRQFYAGEEAVKAVACVALVAEAPVARAIGNFYLALHSPPLPIRLFGDLESALRWASSQA